MKKTLSIAHKIWGSLAVLIMGYLISVGVAFFLGQALESRLHTVSEDLFTAAVRSQAAVAEFKDQVSVYNDMVMIGNMGNAEEIARQKADGVRSALEEIDRLKGIRPERAVEVKKLLAETKAFAPAALAVYLKTESDTDFMFADIDTDEGGSEDEIFRIGQQTQLLLKRLTALSRQFSDDLKGELGEMGSATRHFRFFNLLLFLGIVTIVGIGIWLVMSRAIIRPLKQVIRNLRGCGEELVSSARQGRDTGNELSARSLQQAASIEEISASLEEMSSMTKLNADNTGQTRKIVKNTLGLIHYTDQFMSELMTSMAEISKASRETSHIIKTIDEIAFQTNLLSLNAAVEAARAGEAGAGFAVVAEEVRNLALRSASAARNTAGLIEGNISKIKEGEKITTDTIQAFRAVSVDAEKIQELISEIAGASDNQARGIEQVNAAITEMDQATQRNAATAEESATFSRQVNGRAVQMREAVGALTEMVYGRARIMKAAPPSDASVRSSQAAPVPPQPSAATRLPAVAGQPRKRP